MHRAGWENSFTSPDTRIHVFTLQTNPENLDTKLHLFQKSDDKTAEIPEFKPNSDQYSLRPKLNFSMEVLMHLGDILTANRGEHNLGGATRNIDA